MLVAYGKFYCLFCTTQVRIYQQCGLNNTRVNHTYVKYFVAVVFCYNGRENNSITEETRPARESLSMGLYISVREASRSSRYLYVQSTK